MGANFKVKNPDDIEFTLSITMTLREWNDLSKHIGYTQNWPIANAISDMNTKARQSFYTDVEAQASINTPTEDR